MKEERLWYQTDFAFPGGGQCMCYKHKNSRGNKKRCSSRLIRIAIRPADNEDHREKTFCLDCWARCRDEKTAPDPRQKRLYKMMKAEGMTLMTIGC